MLHDVHIFVESTLPLLCIERVRYIASASNEEKTIIAEHANLASFQKAPRLSHHVLSPSKWRLSIAAAP
jgi:hypothetical protein